MKADGTFSSSSASDSSSPSSSSSTSSDSSDDNGDNSNKCKSGKRNKAKKKISKGKEKSKKRKLDSSDENHGATTDHNADDVIKELAAERDRMKSRMKRLKTIRNRALLDLSDSSDSDKGASSSPKKCFFDPCSVPLVNEKNELDGENKCPPQISGIATLMNESENGDKVKENGFRNDEKACASFNTATEGKGEKGKSSLEHSDSTLWKEVKDTQNGNVPNGTSETPSDETGGNSSYQKAPISTFCDSDNGNSVTNSVNGHTASANALNGHANLVNGHGTSVSNGASTSGGDGATVDSQPIWTGFKRFRNRVEKAHRQYRKSSSHRDNSTCSSGDEA